MKYRLIRTTVATLCLSVAFLGVATADDDELTFEVEDVAKAEQEAIKQRDKDTKGGKPKDVKAFLGDFKFGMSPKQVLKVVKKELDERYDKQINSTMDTYQQDFLRRKKKEELLRVEKTLVKFEGRRSGWDASIVDDQFKHGTKESMLVSWEASQGRSQRRFFFFFKNKLYKIYLTLDMSAVDEEKRNFEVYKKSLLERFGEGMEEWGLVRWNIGPYRVEALDKLAFYTSYCMAISDRKTLRKLEPYRMKNAVKLTRKSGTQQHVVEDDPDEFSLDNTNNPLDRILGD